MCIAPWYGGQWTSRKQIQQQPEALRPRGHVDAVELRGLLSAASRTPLSACPSGGVPDNTAVLITTVLVLKYSEPCQRSELLHYSAGYWPLTGPSPVQRHINSYSIKCFMTKGNNHYFAGRRQTLGGIWFEEKQSPNREKRVLFSQIQQVKEE